MATSLRHRLPGHSRLLICLGVGVLVGAALSPLVGGSFGLLIGGLVLAASFVLSSLVVLWPMDATRTKAHVVNHTFNPLMEEVVVIGASVLNLVAIVGILVSGHAGTKTLGAALGLAGIFLTWAMLHLMYGVRYAHEYYAQDKGGIDFNDQEPPRFVDFLYFSFNLGMTYQVSDNNVSRTQLRAIILRHCVLSFVFTTVILAATVNLVMGVIPS